MKVRITEWREKKYLKNQNTDCHRCKQVCSFIGFNAQMSTFRKSTFNVPTNLKFPPKYTYIQNAGRNVSLNAKVFGVFYSICTGLNFPFGVTACTSELRIFLMKNEFFPYSCCSLACQIIQSNKCFRHVFACMGEFFDKSTTKSFNFIWTFTWDEHFPWAIRMKSI